VIYRLLTREEAATVPGMQDPQPPSLFVLGAVEDDGTVVGAISIFLALCADPLWVRPDHRTGAKLLPRLWEVAREEIVRRGGVGLEVLMLEGNPEPPIERAVARLIEHVGGYEVKARHFFVPVEAD